MNDEGGEQAGGPEAAVSPTSLLGEALGVQGCAVFDGDHKLVYANPNFAAIHGHAAEACRPGATLRELLGDAAVARAGDAAPHTAERNLSDGRAIIEHHQPMPDGGLVVMVWDVGELTAAQTGLDRIRQQAEQANHVKSVFLANMSHELRTPLNAVIGCSELLREEAEDLGDAGEVFNEDLARIHNAGKHLLSLINDVLDLSKIKAGEMDVFYETFDVRRLIDDVEAAVAPLVEAKNNRLIVQCAGDTGALYSDFTKVRQTLLNLLGNAAKFSENGAITLSVTRTAGTAGDRLRFEVADQGIGMTSEQIDGIFDDFRQVEMSATRRYGGIGLGLAICRRFCQIIGGDISVTSAPGEGSTFVLDLPAVAPAIKIRYASPMAVVGLWETVKPAVEQAAYLEEAAQELARTLHTQFESSIVLASPTCWRGPSRVPITATPARRTTSIW